MNTKYFLVIALVITACQTKYVDDEMAKEIKATDIKFSEMAAEKGSAEAFIYFADEKVIKMQQGEYPILGKFALMQYFKDHPESDLSLTWEPLRAEASGNLGYTFGAYQLKTKSADGSRDSVIHGNYVSVWKRKRDGSWRYVVDGGNDTPGPVSLKRTQ
jgi:ketosteroid isomerase-like protein